MRVCTLSKFPPIEGGVASRTYWLARGLVSRGTAVEVVTNAAAMECEYRIPDCDSTQTNPDGLTVHQLRVEVPWHIPFSPDYLARLIARAHGVVEDRKCDVIESGYLVPYGVAGFVVSGLTGIPHIIRHGCSDVVKFLDHPEYRDLLRAVLSHAAAVITDEIHADSLRSQLDNIVVQEPYVVDERAFAVKRREHERPVFAYVGKVNHYWRRRRLDEIVGAFLGIPKDDYELRFVVQGRGLQDFLDSIGQEGRDHIQVRRFVPPWEMPDLLADIDFLIDAAEGEMAGTSSFLVNECVAVSTNVIRVQQDRTEPLADLFSSAIERFQRRDLNATSSVVQSTRFDDWVTEALGVYQKVCRHPHEKSVSSRH